jgi:hypothetical protein
VLLLPAWQKNLNFQLSRIGSSATPSLFKNALEQNIEKVMDQQLPQDLSARTTSNRESQQNLKDRLKTIIEPSTPEPEGEPRPSSGN